MYIYERDFRAVARLWHELSEFPAFQSEEALLHCLDGLKRLVGAENASWAGAIRFRDARPEAPLNGWELHDIHVLHNAEEYAHRNEAILQQFKSAVIDPQSFVMITHVGRTRVCLRSSIQSDDDWKRSWLYQEMLSPLGVGDRLVGAHSVDPSAESYFALDRGKRNAPFDRRSQDLLSLFLSGCPYFHREQLLIRGLLSVRSRLAPRERDVLRLLLTDRSEPEIADSLGLTFNTTHQYIVSIYRKFGVQGRAGLTSCLLRFRRSGNTRLR